MIKESALIGSGKLSLPEWEPDVVSLATQSQSYERGWRRFLSKGQINVEKIYLPLVMAALSGWKNHRLYLAIDTTMLWHKYCMIHLSVVCCGRAVPLLWHVREDQSATVAFSEDQQLLRQARWLRSNHPIGMLFAERAFASYELMAWLATTNWHYALRLKCDVVLQGVKRDPVMVGQLYPVVNQAQLLTRAFRGKLPPKTSLKNVGLWTDGLHRTNASR